MTKSIIIIAVILAIVATTFILLRSNRPVETAQTQQITGESATVLAEKAGRPTKLKQLQGVENAELKTVDDSDSFGSMYRLTASGITRISIEAAMPNPLNNNVYEVWLIQPSPSNVISIGLMKAEIYGETPPDPLIPWTLYFRGDTDYSSYADIVITLESVIDDIPEDHILEGSFQ